VAVFGDQGASVLYLFSSNATWKYFANAMETLGAPRGQVMHYRYRQDYVAPELRARLRSWQERHLSDLRGTRTVLNYVYQELVPPKETDPSKRRGRPEYAWQTVYPLRFGTVEAVYTTGTSNWDIAHFFVKLEDFWSQFTDPREAIDRLRTGGVSALSHEQRQQTGARIANWSACLGGEIPPPQQTGNRPPALPSDESLVLSILRGLKEEHLTWADERGEVTRYFPVVYFVRGVYERDSGEPVKPEYQEISRRAVYHLVEGRDYAVDFSVYTSPHLPYPAEASKLTLTGDEDVLSSPEQYEMAVTSRYDDQAWFIRPRRIDKTRFCDLKLSSKVVGPADADGEPTFRIVDADVQLPIVVEKAWLTRGVEGALEFAGEAGVVFLALVAALSKFVTGTGDVTLPYIDTTINLPNTALLTLAVWVTAKFLARLFRSLAW
jgi:hypothetical protein